MSRREADLFFLFRYHLYLETFVVFQFAKPDFSLSKDAVCHERYDRQVVKRAHLA